MNRDYSETKNELLCKFKEELGKGIDKLNGEDAGKLVDMIKDFSEAEKNQWEAMYYQQVICAMNEKNGVYDSYMDGYSDSRMGYNSNRTANGQYMSRNSRQVYHMQDAPYMDRYLDDGYNMMGYQGGRGNSRMGYEGELMDKYEHYRMAKNQGNKQMADMYAKQYMNDIKMNIRDIMQNADPEMKKEILKMVEEMKS